MNEELLIVSFLLRIRISNNRVNYSVDLDKLNFTSLVFHLGGSLIKNESLNREFNFLNTLQTLLIKTN